MLSINKRTAPYAALVLRVALGAILLFHGLSDEYAQAFASVAPDAVASSILISELLPAIEMVFGVLLIVGFKTRAVALVMIPVLFGAQLANAHEAWVSSSRYGMWEYTIFLCVAGIAQALLGAGACSLRLGASRRSVSNGTGIATIDANVPAVRIRPVRTEDIPALAAILRSIDWLEHLDNESLGVTVQTMTRHLALCQADDSHTVLGAETAEGKLVGYVTVHWFAYLCAPAPEGYVSDLFVAETHRGCGIAPRLLRAVEAVGRQRGASRLMLLNGREWESYKIGFYRRRGWVERDKFANFVFWLHER